MVVYHGINEVRADNCPDGVFREDYGHYAWYGFLNTLVAHDELRWTATPFTLHHAARGLVARLRGTPTIPAEDPRPDWVRRDGPIRTRGPFRRHLEEIVALGEERGTPMLVATFATHVADGYSKEALEHGLLPYGRDGRAFPTELWGDPAYVVRGIEAHNEEIRALAAEHLELGFVDAAREIPDDPELFTDICHFTGPGSRRFAQLISRELRSIRRGSGAAAPPSPGSR